MIHIYKRSTAPLQPWEWIRAGGPNTIATDQKFKFLVLINAEVRRHSGVWHYIFDFDVRDSLEMSDLARLMGAEQAGISRTDANWRTILGKDWERIDEQKRWNILHPPHSRPGEVSITNLQIGKRHRPPRG